MAADRPNLARPGNDLEDTRDYTAVSGVAPAWLWWCCLGLTAAVLLAPLLAVDVPPLLDYPNHLARTVVLAFGDADPALSRMYAAHWSIIPNLAIDLVLPPLLHVLPVYVAGRLVLAFALLLPLAGLLAYSRVVFRERLLWPLASSLIAYNVVFLLGFVNFLIAIGMAFLVAAGWEQWRGRFPLRTSLACAAGAGAIFFCHLAGLFLLGILICAHESEKLFLRWQRHEPVLMPALGSAALMSIVMLPAALLYLASSYRSISSVTIWPRLGARLVGVLDSFRSYNAAIDFATAIVIAGFVVACLLTGCWKMPLRSVIALLMVLILYMFTPFIAKGGAWVSARFSIMAGFLLFAGFTPRQLSRVVAVLSFLVCFCLLLARTGIVTSIWAEHNGDLRELRASIAPVAPGARVLVVCVSPAVNPAFWAVAPRHRRIAAGVTTEIHEAALLVIERHAFWPLLFSVPSQQPISVCPSYRDIAVELSMPPDYHALIPDSPPPADLQIAPYLVNWQGRFDNVLVLDAEGVPDVEHFLPDKLEFLNNTGFAALFRVRHPSPAGWGNANRPSGLHQWIGGYRSRQPSPILCLVR